MKRLLTILLMLLPIITMGQNSYTYANGDVLTSGDQVLVRMRTQSWQGKHGYLYLPPGYDSTESTRYPLICFYHGAGENGDLTALLGQGLPKVIEDGHPPYAVDGSGDTTWFIVYSVSEAAMGSAATFTDIQYDHRFLIDYYRLKIDTNKVYATGLSAGGNTTLEAGGDFRDMFAAIVPMSTVWTTMSTEAREGLNTQHIWQIHGYTDGTANFSSAQTSIEDYNTENPDNKALLATFNGAHCCWTTYYNPTWKWTSNNAYDIGAYNNMNIYTWMIQYSLDSEAIPHVGPTASAGSDQSLAYGTTSVTLDGSGSHSGDGGSLTYSWTKVSGASATITSPTSQTTTVTGLASGSYTFKITVTDDSSYTDNDNVTISVADSPVDDTSVYKIVIDTSAEFWDGDTVFYQLNDLNGGDALGVLFNEQTLADPLKNGESTAPFAEHVFFNGGTITHDDYPNVAVIDLGGNYKITQIYLGAYANTSELDILHGSPGSWSTDTLKCAPTGGDWWYSQMDSGDAIYTRYLKVFYNESYGGNPKISELYLYGHLSGSDSLTRIAPTIEKHVPSIPIKDAIGTNMQWTPNEFYKYLGAYRYYLVDYMADNPDEHNIDSLTYTFGKPNSGTIYYRFPAFYPKNSSVTPGNNEYAVPTLAIDSGAGEFWYASVGFPSWYSNQGTGYPIDITAHPDRDSTNPHNYDRIARRYWNRAAVYGSGNVPEDSLYQVTYPTNHNNGAMKYVEPGNEIDADWVGRSNYFNPHVFASYLSAIYDGHANTMGSRIGVKNADPDIQVIEPGMARGMGKPKYNAYSRSVYYYSHYFRPDHKPLPFDIANFHYYSNNGTVGIPPEQDSARSKIKDFYDMIQQQQPGTPVWWTEFGYDWNGSGVQTVPNHVGTLDSTVLQASWIIRDILAGMGYIDVFTQYQMLDVNPSGGTYATSGLTTSIADSGATGYYPHRSFYYLTTFRNVLGNYTFDSVIRGDAGDSVFVYKFKGIDNDSVAIVAWCPTATDHRINNMAMKTGFPSTGVTLVQFADSSMWGANSSLTSTTDSTVQFQISEVPKFLLTTDGTSAGELVSGDEPVDTTGPTANAGPDQAIRLPTNSITLAGSATEGTSAISTHVWSKVSGSGGTITTPTSYTSTVTGLTSGTYVLKLVVTDENGLKDSDEVAITVNAAYVGPTAHAGADQTLDPGTTSTTLSGSATAGDGTMTGYAWTQISGTTVTIDSPTSASTSISGLADGNTYVFRLTVTDSNDLTDSDDVSVTVSSSPPPTGTLTFKWLRNIGGHYYLIYENMSTGRYYYWKIL